MPSPCFKRLTCILSLLSFVTESLRYQTVRSLAALLYLGRVGTRPDGARPTRGGSSARGLSPHGRRSPWAPSVQRTQKGPARSSQLPAPCSSARASSESPTQRRPVVTKADARGRKGSFLRRRSRLRQDRGAAF